MATVRAPALRALSGSARSWFERRVGESTHCRECGAKIKPFDSHCHNCGQGDPAKVNVSALPVVMGVSLVCLLALSVARAL
ncbi:MAG: hypothetical protein KDA37_01275 [Planctomycetales bacterium]|nr:hypothetical protein [Planctomycetales bacterium]